MNKKAKTHSERIIALNRKASHDYFIENRFEAGLALEGWEVKSLREGRAQLKESYVVIKNGAAWLLGAHISPTKNISTHVTADPLRTRKLLLNKKELSHLSIAKERQGYTIVALDLHWTNNRAKVQIALAKGKKTYDKRETEKRKTWERERQRLLKPKR